MPCRDYDTGDDLRELSGKLNRATRAACEMAKLLRRYEKFSKVSKDVRKWVYEHDAMDARRTADEIAAKKQESLRRQATAKLSPKERKALNL